MFDDQNKIEPENLRNKILFCNHNLVRSTLLWKKGKDPDRSRIRTCD